MPVPAMRVDVYPHNFHLSKFGPEVTYALRNYVRQNLAQWGQAIGPGRQPISEIKQEFVAVNDNGTQFGFLRPQYKDIVAYLGAHGYTEDRMEIIEHPAPAGVPVHFTLRELFVPRDYQPPLINYLVEPGPIKVVELQTGKGKTKIALKALEQIGKRTILVIRPKYINKWIEDVEKFYKLEKGDLMVVRGGDSLRRVVELAQAGELKAKFIIFSNATLRSFLTEHEQFNGEISTYGTTPQEFCGLLGAGVALFDEAHRDFHFNYRFISYINVEKVIALSATLDPDDRMMKKRYQTLYPLDQRSPPVAYDKYIEVQALFYEMESMDKMRYKNFFRQYQHPLFEQSIIKRPSRLEHYKQMVGQIVKYDFARVAQPGMRCLVFFATIEMCTIMQKYLEGLLPQYKVRRYVGKDDYANLKESDIVVSTLGSAGEAEDVPNLAVSIMTVALNSKQFNLQGLGRTRRLQDFPDFTPKFIYLVCTSIDKHRQYHEEKIEKFHGKVLGHKQLQTNFRI